MGKYLSISSYILVSPSSYIMTLQLLHTEFPYIRGKYYFLFYQCTFLTLTTKSAKILSTKVHGQWYLKSPEIKLILETGLENTPLYLQ
jgi:hypothetical protein